MSPQHQAPSQLCISLKPKGEDPNEGNGTGNDNYHFRDCSICVRKRSKTVPMTCEAAIHKAEAVVVSQKHGYKEPGPQDMVLKITSSNVGKTVGAAVVFPPALLWAHPKFGALTFSASTDGKSCIVKSTGQPANQALKDWDKDSN